MTEAERKQCIAVQDAVSEIIDEYLKDGLDPEYIRTCLEDERTSDLYARRQELTAVVPSEREGRR